MASTIENNLNPDVSVGLSFPLGFVGSRFFNRTKTNQNRLNVSIDFSVATSPDATDQIVLDFNSTG